MLEASIYDPVKLPESGVTFRLTVNKNTPDFVRTFVNAFDKKELKMGVGGHQYLHVYEVRSILKDVLNTTADPQLKESMLTTLDDAHSMDAITIDML